MTCNLQTDYYIKYTRSGTKQLTLDRVSIYRNNNIYVQSTFVMLFSLENEQFVIHQLTLIRIFIYGQEQEASLHRNDYYGYSTIRYYKMYICKVEYILSSIYQDGEIGTELIMLLFLIEKSYELIYKNYSRDHIYIFGGFLQIFLSYLDVLCVKFQQ